MLRSRWCSLNHKYMTRRPKHAHREAAHAGGTLAEFQFKATYQCRSEKSLLQPCPSAPPHPCGKTRSKEQVGCPNQALSSLLLAVSLRQPSPTAATTGSRGGCRAAGRLSIIFHLCETSLGEAAKLLPCPALPLSRFTVLVSCGDVVVHLAWLQSSS